MSNAERVTFLDAVVEQAGRDVDWVRVAADQLSRRYPADDVVVSAGVGWMRLGPQGAPVVDTLFVVTPEAILFTGSSPQVDPARVLLSEIVGLDLLEGLPLPLEAIEVRIQGDLAVLVGWPTEFREQVLAVLTGGWPPAPPDVEAEPVPGTATDHEAHDDRPAGWTPEPTVTPDLVPLPGQPGHPGHPGHVEASAAAVDAESPAAPDLPDGSGGPAAPAPLAPDAVDSSSTGTDPADHLGDVDQAEAVETAEAVDPIGDVDQPEAVGAGPTGAGHDHAPLIDQVLGELPEQVQESVGDEWPAPFRPVTLVGGTGEGSKRRRNVTVTFDAEGLHLATGGLGSWKHDIGPDDVAALEVGGVDELMFTHSLRIGAGSAAMIVKTAAGDELILEVPDIGPHDLRTVLAGCLVRWGRTGAAAGVVTIF